MLDSIDKFENHLGLIRTALSVAQIMLTDGLFAISKSPLPVPHTDKPQLRFDATSICAAGLELAALFLNSRFDD